jgi:hypothetical protein
LSGTGGVLVVLDGSAQDIATLDWATDEAAALGTGLTVAHLHAEPVAPERAPTPLPAGRRWPEPGVLDVAAGRVAERAARVPVTTRWAGAAVPGFSPRSAAPSPGCSPTARCARW